ncbi:hypothetical protein C8Q80DRAFT_1190800 [Daedaleopsis nitida]|nr:hypothetical protein C8Q80DRAFT_1190800 [Daedaleopsis nitida]
MFRSARWSRGLGSHISLRTYAHRALPGSLLRKHVGRTLPSTILDMYRKHCPHPHLTLLSPAVPQPDAQSDSAQPDSTQSVSVAEQAAVSELEYARWAPVVHAPSLASALDSIHCALPSTNSTETPALPTWVLLAVLYKRPATDVEAFSVYSLALSHPPSAAPELTPLLILLSAYWLSQLRMYAPLRSVVLRAIHSENKRVILQPYHVSLFLRILAQAPPSPEIQHMIVILLDLAIRRGMDLGVRTYRALLENRTASFGTARLVEIHMKTRRYAPNLSHSRAFVRIYGRGGRRTMAARYWWRIRKGEYHGPHARYATYRRPSSRALEDYLRSFKDPKKLNLYVKYLLKTTARAEHDPELKRTAPTLPRADGIPRPVYIHTLRSAMRRLTVPADDLLNTFRAGVQYLGSPKKVLVAYFLVIKGLLMRGKSADAMKLLEEILHRTNEFDASKLSIAAEALTMVNRPDAALRLLLQSSRPSNTANAREDEDSVPPDESSQPGSSANEAAAPRPIIVDTRTINGFMISLLRIGRPDAVFYLWDTLPQVFAVEPDSKTLAILLKAARFARKCEGVVQVAIADFGADRLFGGVAGREADPRALSRADALHALDALLRPDDKLTVTGFWRGERAGAVALRVAWQVLVGNWPILRLFDSPFRPVRRSAGEQATSPLADLWRGFVARRSAVHDAHGKRHDDRPDQGDEERGLAVQPVDEDGRTYFGIVPEDALFRALFDLLAEEERADQIPLVLTWMRYMRVWPSPDTLATALVYWGEVTLEGPWIERMREWRARSQWEEREERKGDWRKKREKKYGLKKYESEYVRMVKWMTKWVGWKNTPRSEQTQRALQRVRWFRDMRAFRPLRSRDVEGDWSHL